MDRQRNDYRKRVGRRIQRARKAKELSQHELAHAVDVQDNAVSRWENGRHMPSPPMLERIGNALGVHAETFLRDDDEDDVPLAATG